jgi:hypothetical protein
MWIKGHYHCKDVLGVGMRYELTQKLLMTMMHAIKYPDSDNTWPG